MQTASTFSIERWAMRKLFCTPSPQSIKNKRPCTLSTWALEFLSAMGIAEAMPRIFRVKFIYYSPFSSLSLRAARASISPRVVFSTLELIFFTARLVFSDSAAAAFSLTSA